MSNLNLLGVDANSSIEVDDRTVTPPLSPVRIMVSPEMVPRTPDSPILIPSLPTPRSIPSLQTPPPPPPPAFDPDLYELYCPEEVVEPPPSAPMKNRGKRRGLIEPVEDVVDRSISCLTGQVLSLSTTWQELQVKVERMKREIQGLKRTISHYEDENDRLKDENDQLKQDVLVERTCAQILTRTCHRMKKVCLDKQELTGEEECPICNRTSSELLMNNLPLVMISCCANQLCLYCIVQLTHIQHTSTPACPFCRSSLC